MLARMQAVIKAKGHIKLLFMNKDLFWYGSLKKKKYICYVMLKTLFPTWCNAECSGMTPMKS